MYILPYKKILQLNIAYSHLFTIKLKISGFSVKEFTYRIFSLCNRFLFFSPSSLFAHFIFGFRCLSLYFKSSKKRCTLIRYYFNFINLLQNNQIQKVPMSKLSDCRKIYAQSAISSQEDGILLRMTTNNSVLMNTPPSMDELKKVIKQLQNQLKNQKEMRLDAEQNLKNFQIRTIAREKQFHNILQISNKHIKAFKSSTADNNQNIIKKTYDQIFDNFQRTNQATNQIIQRKYKQNLHAMERKISNVLEVFNDQMNRSKRLSSDSFKEVKTQIQKALAIVKNVQAQNIELRISLKQEKYRSKLMQEERKLLLEQMVNKKLLMTKILTQNKKLKQQVVTLKQYRKLSMQTNQKKNNRKISKTNEGQQNSQIQQNQKLKTLSTTLCQFQSREQYQKPSNKFFNEIIIMPEDKKIRQKSDCSPSYSHYKQQSRGINKKLAKHSLILNHKGLDPRKNQIKFLNSSKKSVSSNNCNRKIQFNEQQNIGLPIRMLKSKNKNNYASIHMEDQIDKISQSNQNTICHLKQCLERERKKVSELRKTVAKIQNKNQQVNEAIIEALNQSKQGEPRNKNLIQSGIKSQKLMQVIGDLKKRLAICQNPAAGCGWGQINVEQLLDQQY